jgi:hypothetical protein
VAFAFFSTAVAAIIVEVDSFFGTGVDLAEARTMFASAGFAFSSCFRAVGSSATETCCTCTGFISEALCFVCNVGKGLRCVHSSMGQHLPLQGLALLLSPLWHTWRQHTHAPQPAGKHEFL